MARAGGLQARREDLQWRLTASEMAFAAVSLLTMLSVFHGILSRTLPSEAAVAVAILATLLVGAILLATRERIRSIALRANNAALRVPVTVWLAGCVALGLALRYGWSHLYPAELSSDYRTYFDLAQQLYDEGRYGDELRGRAYWPPGLPFTLYGLATLLGSTEHVVAALGTAVFLATLGTIFLLGRLLSLPAATRWALLLLAVWPNLVFSFALPAKEPLVMLLVTASALLYLAAIAGRGMRLRTGVPAGVLLGGAILTQPSLVLTPLLYLAAAWIGRENRARRLLTVFLPTALAAILTVIPWTIRNYLVLGAFVPVSNTAGLSLLVGNNPDADGGYVDVASRLRATDEVSRNKEASRIAARWIVAHPGAFLALVPRKVARLLETDSNYAYFVLRHTGAYRVRSYAAHRLLSDGFWLAIMAGVFAAAATGLLRQLARPPRASVLFTGLLLYPLAIHAIFESGARHHMIWYPLLALAVGTLGERFREDSLTEASAQAVLGPARIRGVRS